MTFAIIPMNKLDKTNIIEERKNMIYKKLREYVPERLYLVYGGMLMAFLAAMFSIASYYYLYGFLNNIIVQGDMAMAVQAAMKVVAFMAANTLVYFLSLWTTHALGFRLETNLKKLGIQRLMRASFSFYDKNESGRIRKIIDDNTVMTHMSIAHLIPDLTTAVFSPLLGIGLTFYVDYRMGILFTLTLLSGMFFIQKMMGDKSFLAAYMKAAETMNAGAVEYVRGIHVLKIFKTSVQSLKAFYQAVMGYSDLALRYSMSCRVWYVIFQVFFNAIFLAVLFFSYLFDGRTTVFLAKFMFYVVFSGTLYLALMKVMYVGMYTFQASSAIDKIEELFAKMDEKNITHGDVNAMGDASIEFQDVSFGYDDAKVIDHLSFKLEEGKTYALVGSSGSGKSTLAKLISGFYALDGGKILIGGCDISEYSEKALAANIANVFQDAKLFKKTIYENVSLGRPSASKAEVMQALHLAQCDEILNKFEQREQTMIGAKGVHLSGGEVQRIAIARAMLKDAKIIIMDEASAAADPENEYELQKALANLMKGKTVIMIAHRLSSIKSVDEILVIEDGKVAERGSHTALMETDTQYKKLQEAFMRANEWRVKQ